MKTREEIAQELADKKKSESLSKEILEVKSLFKAFLSDFKATNIKLEHSYSLKDEVSLKQLNNAINNIPKEFKIKHTTDKVSNKFLWWYFILSTLFLSLSISATSYFYFNTSKIEREAFEKGQIQGQKNVYKILPQSSKKFLKEKYPNSFSD